MYVYIYTYNTHQTDPSIIQYGQHNWWTHNTKPNFPSRLQGISLRAYEYQIQNIQLLQEEIDFFLYKCFVKIFKNCNLDVKKEFDRDGVDVEYTSGPVELV